MDSRRIEQQKELTRAWFETLRDRIIIAFEGLEDGLPAGAPFADRPAGRFTRTPWSRTDHSGAPGGGGVPPLAVGCAVVAVGMVSAVS